jgi:chemotaxis signal transduction protein
MTTVDDRFLVFRLGEYGFVLALDNVVEVVDHVIDKFDFKKKDPVFGIVAAFEFRQTLIPVVDPALRLGIKSPAGFEQKHVVVLQGSEGCWALLIDAIEELTSERNLQVCKLTPLLQKMTNLLLCNRLKMFKNEPLIVFSPEHFYGSQVGPL